MYNKLVKNLLSKVSIQDARIYPDQIRYRVSDSFSTIEIYVSNEAISFKVLGDAYIVAMTKWLQLKLQSKEDMEFSLEYLRDIFELPEIKYRNALQIKELIEKLNER